MTQQKILWPDSIVRLISDIQFILMQVTSETHRIGSAFHYSCEAGCGRCCTTPDIEALPLEMLPAAKRLIESGDVEKIFEARNDLPCPLYQPKNADTPAYGSCLLYQDRPSICRLFGYSFQVLKGEPHLALCRVLKDAYPNLIEITYSKDKNWVQTNQFSLQIGLLGPSSLSGLMPVRKALQTAIAFLSQSLAYSS